MITENQHSKVIKIGNGREYTMAKELLKITASFTASLLPVYCQFTASFLVFTASFMYF